MTEITHCQEQIAEVVKALQISPKRCGSLQKNIIEITRKVITDELCWEPTTFYVHVHGPFYTRVALVSDEVSMVILHSHDDEDTESKIFAVLLRKAPLTFANQTEELHRFSFAPQRAYPGQGGSEMDVYRFRDRDRVTCAVQVLFFSDKVLGRYFGTGSWLSSCPSSFASPRSFEPESNLSGLQKITLTNISVEQFFLKHLFNPTHLYAATLLRLMARSRGMESPATGYLSP
jgi:hypothetical protein